MKSLSRYWVTLVVLGLSVSFCEMLAIGQVQDCHMTMPDNQNTCTECRLWFVLFGSYHRCKEPTDESTCFGPIPNGTTSCEDKMENCPGPARIYADDDFDCFDSIVSTNPICPAWRKYARGELSAATSGCD